MRKKKGAPAPDIKIHITADDVRRICEQQEQAFADHILSAEPGAIACIAGGSEEARAFERYLRSAAQQMKEGKSFGELLDEEKDAYTPR